MTYSPASNQLSSPLVSIIGLCYNHEKFLEEALDSILEQSYEYIEVIVVDDASQDNSVLKIKQWFNKNGDKFYSSQIIIHQHNTGNCQAFNEALAHAQGNFIIDFALDDLMLPDRVQKQVETFKHLPLEYGVVFSNARLINPKGKFLKNHYPIDEKGNSKVEVPTGQVFKEVLEKYFICPPTMMIKKEVLLSLGGYDSSLAYEDFDFWIRASRNFQFYYQDEILTCYRKHPNSYSEAFYKKKGNKLLASTLLVLHKAYDLCQTPEEYKALARNASYHFRQSFFMEDFELAQAYGKFLKKEFLKSYKHWMTPIINLLTKYKIPIYGLYKAYIFWKKLF